MYNAFGCWPSGWLTGWVCGSPTPRISGCRRAPSLHSLRDIANRLLMKGPGWGGVSEDLRDKARREVLVQIRESDRVLNALGKLRAAAS